MLLLGASNASGQVTIDVPNRYPNVGALMVWRVDEMTKADSIGGVRKRHADSRSGHGDGRSLHGSGQRCRGIAGYASASLRASVRLPQGIQVPGFPWSGKPHIHRCRTARRRPSVTLPTRYWSLRLSPGLQTSG